MRPVIPIKILFRPLIVVSNTDCIKHKVTVRVSSLLRPSLLDSLIRELVYDLGGKNKRKLVSIFFFAGKEKNKRKKKYVEIHFKKYINMEINK